MGNSGISTAGRPGLQRARMNRMGKRGRRAHPSPQLRAVMAAAFLGALFSACAPAGRSVGQPTAGDGAASLQGCGSRELSRQRLTVGGRPLYVEADAFVADGRGDVLLAGTPNYLWKISPAGEINGLTADSIFGAVIARDGTSRAVPAPIDPRLIHGIRAVGRPDGGWDVVFAEIPLSDRNARVDSVVNLWHGVFDGRQWVGLEEIPRPRDVPLHPQLTSSLVRREGSLAWALVPLTSYSSRDLVLFQRVDGRWTHETVPTRFAVDVDLSYSDSLGLLLAVVQPDPTLRADGNSLLLWARQPDWRIIRRLVHGYGEGRVNFPSLVRIPGGLLASWSTPTASVSETRWQLLAKPVLLDGEQDETAISLDADISLWSEVPPLIRSGGMPLWVTDHGAASEPGAASEIRIVSLTGREALEVGRAPSPYLMRLAAVEQRPGEVVVTGMEYQENRFAFSLLLRVRLECAPGERFRAGSAVDSTLLEEAP